MQNDKPKQGKQYLLIGDGTQPSIANGDTWEDAEVKTDGKVKMWRSREGYNYIVDKLWLGQWTYVSQWAAHHGFSYGHLKKFFDEDSDPDIIGGQLVNLHDSESAELDESIRQDLYFYSIQLLGHIGYLSELIAEVRYSPHYSARDRCPACWADDFALPPETLCQGCRDAGDTYQKSINRQTEL